MDKKKMLKRLVFGLFGSKGWAVMDLRNKLRRNDKLTIVSITPPH